MFNSATPPARRLRGGAGGANRNKTTLPASSELPYVSPISNYSYGSKATNVPKPPRLSDTRIRLADAMQAKKDEMDARIRAEQEELARKAAARNSSVPPPSPAKSQGTMRTSREQTVASTRATSEMNDLSALSGMENSRTFTSEFVINPIVTTNVKQSGVELGVVEVSNIDQDPPELPNGRVPGDPVPTSITQALANDVSDEVLGLDLHDGLGPDAASTAFNPLVSPRRSTRVRRGPDTITGGGGKDAGGRNSKSKGTGGKGTGKAAGSNPLKQPNSGDKENGGANGESLGRGGGRRPPGKAGSTNTETWAGRRKSRRPYSDDDGRPPNAFDKFFRWYYNSSRWLVPGIFFVMVWLFVIFLLVQSWRSMMDGTSYGSDRTGIYIPPLQEPGNIHELVERLRALEKNLGSVDSRLQQKFQDGISGLKSALSKASSDSVTTSSRSAKSAKETAAILSSLQSQFEDLQRETEQHKKELKRTKEEFKRASKHIQVPGSKQIRDEISKAVRDALPSTLAATLKSDGTVEISKQFNAALHDLFDTFFQPKFDQAIKTAKLDIEAVPSWQSFLKDNDERLKETIEKRVDGVMKSRTSKNEAVLTPETVMLVVREKMEQYQRDLGKTIQPMMDRNFDKYKASLERDQNERLSSFKTSIEREQAALVQRAAETASAVANRIARDSSARSGGQKHTGPFSASGVQIPDYANKLTGASIWPYLTSPSYEYNPDEVALTSLLGRLIPWTGRYTAHPVTAIMPSQDVGECWPFPGSYGTLAIRLSERIYPSHVTIEHAPKQLSLDYKAAPKTIEFWVQIKNATERAIVESHALRLAELSGKKDAASRIMRHAPPSPDSVAQAIDKRGRDFVKLNTFKFDIDAGGAQSFEMLVDMARLGVAVNIVAFVVKENHGNEEFTCLYRTKVHGFTPAHIKGETGSSGKAKTTRGWW